VTVEPRGEAPEPEASEPQPLDAYVPRLEKVFGKGQVKIERSDEAKFGYRTVRYRRAKVSFLIDVPALDRFIAKQDTLYAPAGTKPVPAAKTKRPSSPAGTVHIDELTPEARERVMAQIEKDPITSPSAALATLGSGRHARRR
jgi:hypothetical protein